MDEEPAETLAAPSTGIDSVRASFAIRWDPGAHQGDSGARKVTGRLGNAVVLADVSTTSIRPSASEQGDLMLQDVLDSLEDYALGDDMIVVGEPDPLCLVTLQARLDPPVVDVITIDTVSALQTVSYGGLLGVTDEVLHLATLALGAACPERAFGPIAYGDLVGAGVVRLQGPGLPTFDLPILPRPQLGSWGPGPSAQDLSADPQTIFGHLLSSRRLLMWVDRFQLRFARGEWSEAIVAFEAATEAGIWTVFEYLLIDHGWGKGDLDGSAMPGNAKSAQAAVQAHLGGDWTPVRDDFARLWDMRNRALHRSEYMTHGDVQEAVGLGESFRAMVQAQLSRAAVARKHPVSAYLIGDDAEAALGPAVFEVISRAIDGARVDDHRHLNDCVHPDDRRTARAGECPIRSDALWTSKASERNS